MPFSQCYPIIAALLDFAHGLQKQILDFLLVLHLGLDDRAQTFNGPILQESSLCGTQGFLALLYSLRVRHVDPR
jgi:hypothetical protein